MPCHSLPLEPRLILRSCSTFRCERISRMTSEPNDQTIVLLLLRGVPERADEISGLWAKYAPAVDVTPSAVGTTMSANWHHVRFTQALAAAQIARVR